MSDLRIVEGHLPTDELRCLWAGFRNIYWFTAYVGDEWAGVGAIRFHNYYLGPCYVRPEFRGQGIQRKLIEARIDFAKRFGYPYLVSCTDLENIASQTNLKKCGFHQTQLDDCGQTWFRKDLNADVSTVS